MENINAEVIIDLYTRYQHYIFMNAIYGIPGWLLFAIGGVVFFVNLSDEITLGSTIPFLLGVALLTFWGYNLYQLEVVLKTDIARIVVPVGLDAVDIVSKGRGNEGDSDCTYNDDSSGNGGSALFCA